MAFKDKASERAYKKAWNLANAEKLSKYFKQHYAANRESVKARVRAYAAARPKEIAARAKAYREANKEQLSGRQKTYYQAHRAERIAAASVRAKAKRDEILAYQKRWWAEKRAEKNADRRTPEYRSYSRKMAKQWYDANYERDREKFSARNRKRDALKRGATVETVDYRKVLRDSKGICGICKKPLDLFGIDFDHIVPLSKGGAHTRANLQATHSSCNRRKGAKVG